MTRLPPTATKTLLIALPDPSVVLQLRQELSPEEFAIFSAANPELRIERAADGTVTLMSPVSTLSGDRESEFIADLKIYARSHGGKAYSSSTGFTLPDGSIRSPDASYVSADRLAAVSEEELRGFADLVPNFVVEVLSPSDSLNE